MPPNFSREPTLVSLISRTVSATINASYFHYLHSFSLPFPLVFSPFRSFFLPSAFAVLKCSFLFALTTLIALLFLPPQSPSFFPIFPFSFSTTVASFPLTFFEFLEILFPVVSLLLPVFSWLPLLFLFLILLPIL